MEQIETSESAEESSKGLLFSHKVYILLSIFTLWSLLIVFQLYQVSVQNRDQIISEFEQSTTQTGILTACRGRVLDRDGLPLAWSERVFCLQYEIAPSVDKVWAEMNELEQVFGGESRVYFGLCEKSRGRFCKLIVNLSAEDMLKLKSFVDYHDSFEIVSVFTRKYHNRKLMAKIGLTKMLSNQLVGVSGYEKYFDHRLKGKDGRYQVRVDNAGNWIPGTWKEITRPVAGFDVYLKFSLKNIPEHASR